MKAVNLQHVYHLVWGFLPQVLELTSSALFNQDNSAMRKLSCMGNLDCRSLCCNDHVKETDTVAVNADKKTQTRLFIIKLLYNRQTSDKQIFSNFICITATGCLNEMWVNEGTLCFYRDKTHIIRHLSRQPGCWRVCLVWKPCNAIMPKVNNSELFFERTYVYLSWPDTTFIF